MKKHLFIHDCRTATKADDRLLGWRAVLRRAITEWIDSHLLLLGAVLVHAVAAFLVIEFTLLDQEKKLSVFLRRRDVKIRFHFTPTTGGSSS